MEREIMKRRKWSKELSELETTHILDGDYVSKFQAAEYLDIPAKTLQWHIREKNIPTINFPRLGHMIEKQDVLKFKEVLDEIRPGRPTIYEKVE